MKQKASNGILSKIIYGFKSELRNEIMHSASDDVKARAILCFFAVMNSKWLAVRFEGFLFSIQVLFFEPRIRGYETV